MERIADRILKVNHAGEHGAVQLYAGQIALARCLAPDLLPSLQEFIRHEQLHRRLFEMALAERQQTRCFAYALCGLGGYVLGLLSVLGGRRVMMLTTVAIEQVVLLHLKQQMQLLHLGDPAAAEVIAEIVADEQQHHDYCAQRLGEVGKRDLLTKHFVAALTEAVIWLGMLRFSCFAANNPKGKS